MEKLLQVTYLYDFYGQLLTPKQEKVFKGYYLEDLSLSEIAAEEEVSRQSIHDTIKQAERKLTTYEQKLGLVERFKKQEQELEIIINKMEDIQSNNQDNNTNSIISDVIESMHKLLND
ncbi:MAG TPA: YlxM family DNA-binding protein [Epulopiscium sp.]|nr:YlxM family DNA-binding protein [Candidatus Epulonipiscium sp.]